MCPPPVHTTRTGAVPSYPRPATATSTMNIVLNPHYSVVVRGCPYYSTPPRGKEGCPPAGADGHVVLSSRAPIPSIWTSLTWLPRATRISESQHPPSAPTSYPAFAAALSRSRMMASTHIFVYLGSRGLRADGRRREGGGQRKIHFRDCPRSLEAGLDFRRTTCMGRSSKTPLRPLL